MHHHQMQQQCDMTTETMTTTSTYSSYESSSSLSDLSSLDAADNNPGIIIQSNTTPMIWWPESDCKAKPKLTKRAKQCATTSTKRVTFNDDASFNFFTAGESNDVACC
jgi:hypothetical protein